MGRVNGVHMPITKSFVVGTIHKNLDISFSTDNAFQFLVDTIAFARTLRSLNYLIKSAPAGNIPALTVARRQLVIADDTSNANPTGTNSITKRDIAYAVQKFKWDEWLSDDDVIENATRMANNTLVQQPGITSTSDLESLVMQILQKALAVDLQDLFFNGDTAYPANGTDATFIRSMDGIVKLTNETTHRTDLTSNNLTLANLATHVSVLPEKYRDNFGEDIAWFMNRATHDRIMALIAAKETGYADAVIQDGQVTRLFGYDIEIVSGMVGPLSAPADATSARLGYVILTPRANLVPVTTQDVKYKRAAEGALAASKDSTYHVFFAYLDAVVREIDGVAVMIGENV